MKNTTLTVVLFASCLVIYTSVSSVDTFHLCFLMEFKMASLPMFFDSY